MSEGLALSILPISLVAPCFRRRLRPGSDRPGAAKQENASLKEQVTTLNGWQEKLRKSGCVQQSATHWQKQFQDATTPQPPANAGDQTRGGDEAKTRPRKLKIATADLTRLRRNSTRQRRPGGRQQMRVS